MKKILSLIPDKKFITYCLIGVALVFICVLLVKDGGTQEEILIVNPGDFVQQVSVSGKVIAAQSVNLVFSQSGRVASVFFNVGDYVAGGTILASIENGDLRADVLQKEAALDVAKAKLQALKEGTRVEQLAITESKVQSAETVFAQTKEALVDDIKDAYTKSDDAIRRRVDQFMLNPRSAEPKLNITVESSLKATIEWERFRIENMLVSWKASSDPIDVTNNLDQYVAISEKNLDQIRSFLDLVSSAVNSLSASPSLPQATVDAYRADVTTARTNVNTVLSALTSGVTSERNAEASLITAKKNLELEKAGATEEAMAEEEARVKIAEADVLNSRAKFQQTLIIAPFTGTITRMDYSVGESASAETSRISLISKDTLQIESFVPEINAPLVKVEDDALVMLDAYGTLVSFPARVISIDPAETIRDGVSTYRTKLRFADQDERIKPGMTANVVITTERKSNVISIPQRVVVESGTGKIVYVRNGENIEDRVVETGDISSLGTVEILSGLSFGDVILLDHKKE